jgi:hypothetical protein
MAKPVGQIVRERVELMQVYLESMRSPGELLTPVSVPYLQDMLTSLLVDVAPRNAAATPGSTVVSAGKSSQAGSSAGHPPVAGRSPRKPRKTPGSAA